MRWPPPRPRWQRPNDPAPDPAALAARLDAALAGRYAIEREVGHGGMATVFLARDLRHRRPVAIKVLHDRLSAAIGPPRFFREIETAANLSHPHILPLFDSGEADGALYYVMPYVAGTSLRERLRRRAAAGQGPLPTAEVSRVVCEVADALDYAHRRGVIHRDIKPENILLDEDGRTRVADFGVALAVEHRGPPAPRSPLAATAGYTPLGSAVRNPSGETTAPAATDGATTAGTESAPRTGAPVTPAHTALTSAGSVVGTPAYMSPEQSIAGAAVGGASDQYALACVAFELLAGTPAFAGPLHALTARRLTEAPPSLPAVRAAERTGAGARRGARAEPQHLEASGGAHLDPRAAALADAVLARGLAREPAARYPTATAFAEALGEALGTTAGPPAAPPARALGTRRRALAAAAVVLALGTAGAFAFRPHPGPAGAAPATLAVLPFENLGDSASAYFADGVSDELRGRLAALSGLRVIASASSRQYRATAKPLPQVARELGVRYLLVGRVRRAPGPDGVARVRVDPELVDATGGPVPATRWQHGFDAPLRDVFRVQGDIATEVTAQLRVALVDGEAHALADAPTRSLDAYDQYLRAQAALARGGLDDQRQAAALFEEVVRRDPNFALAWAGLAVAETGLYNQDAAGSARHRDNARRASERALALAPDEPEVQGAAAAYTTYVRKEPERALAALAAAREHAPYNAQLLRRTAYAERARGHLEASVVRGEETLRLDPRSNTMFYWLGLSLLDLRRYAEARAAFDRVLELQPTLVYPRVKRALVEVAAGDLTRARAVLGAGRAPLDAGPLAANVARFGYDAAWLLDPAVQRVVRERGMSAFAADDRANAGMMLARLWALAGDARRARAYADTAHAGFAAAAALLAANPQVAAEQRARDAVALAYAGRPDEALARATDAAAAVPLGTGEHPIGYNIQLDLARVYALRGDRARALDHLEPLLRVPGVVSPGWLRVDPELAPLRADPRFARLAAGP